MKARILITTLAIATLASSALLAYAPNYKWKVISQSALDMHTDARSDHTPTLRKFTGDGQTDAEAAYMGVYLLHFADANTEQVFGQFSIPHEWERGTIYPHLIWSNPRADATTDSSDEVVIGLEYVVADIGETFGTTTTATTTLSLGSTAKTLRYVMLPAAGIAMTTTGIGAKILYRLSRHGASVDDTSTDEIAIIGVDWYYQSSDTASGSRKMYIK